MNYTEQFQESMEEFKTFADNLKKGIENLASLDEIKVGETAKELVYEDGKRKLYRYQARSKKVCPVPTLIVYAMVNRYTVLDLQPNRSMIRNLLDQGMDVYLIDWGYADRMDRHMTMDDLINGFVDDCVDHIREQHQLDAINLLGVAQSNARVSSLMRKLESSDLFENPNLVEIKASSDPSISSGSKLSRFNLNVTQSQQKKVDDEENGGEKKS